tara:strand:+ start:689 stop:1171 length:483 start_codon:yes stop_codon:yes gene_type:complete
MEVIENYLPHDYFEHLQKSVLSCNFPWLYEAEVANLGENQSEHFYFTHRIYEEYAPKSSFFQECVPFFEQLEMNALVRARALLYVNQGKQIVHEKHTDYNFEHKTAVFYLNTNNGYTEFEDGTKVESVENRIVLFDGSKPHNSSTCTDQKVRVVLSINYF